MEGTRSSQFEIIEPLAASIGDFAVASYKAREKKSDDDPGRVVLMRRLPAGADSQSVWDASARYAALPAHPNVLTYYGLEEVDNGAIPAGVYAVSEWARGITLRERIQRVAPFSTIVSLDIAIAVAQVLNRAEALGMEHGELQPEHIMLTSEGRVKIADFAIGRAIRESQGVIVPGERSTQAVGRLLYEMITAQNAEIGSGALMAAQVVPSTPLTIRAIIEKATQPSTEAGYGSLNDLLTDLQSARDDLRAGKLLTWNPMEQADRASVIARIPAAATPSEEVVADETAIMKSRSDQESMSAQDDYDDDYYEDPPRVSGSWIRTVITMLGVLAVVGIVFVGAYVYMVTSGVPADITVPNLIGKQYTDVQSLAGHDHFVLNEASHDFSNTWPPGAIYQQDPAAGRSIKSGKPVSVWVSDGPQLLTVPDLSQMTQSKANGVLQDSGLPSGTIQSQYDPVVPKGIVTSQTPPSGSKVARNTAVNFVVSNGPPPPPAPTNVSATSSIPGEIDISWNDDPISATYNVYRDGKEIASALPQTTYSDVNVPDSTAHTYTITALNGNGESPPSQATTATALSNDSADLAAAPAQPPPSVATAGGPPTQRQFEIKFRVPGSGRKHNVQIEVQDTTGSNLVFDQDEYSGETIDEHLTAFGNRVVFRIFLDGKLVKQETK